MDAILLIYYKNNDVILNTKKNQSMLEYTVIKYSIEWLAT